MWYEGPEFVIADKPPGMAVYPESPQGSNTLVNTLLQSNRWLAEMETSHRPGVIHILDPDDRGLVLVAKTDEAAETLQADHTQGRLTFTYRVRLPRARAIPAGVPLTLCAERVFADGSTVMVVQSPIGDTARLKAEWLSGQDTGYWVSLAIKAPQHGVTVQTALGSSGPIPSIDLWTVPPCSICNGVKQFIADYGFWYTDHTLTEPANVEEMRRLRGEERGIPVIRLNEEILVGFNRLTLKERLGLY